MHGIQIGRRLIHGSAPRRRIPTNQGRVAQCASSLRLKGVLNVTNSAEFGTHEDATMLQ